MALRFQHEWLLWPPVVAQVMYINTDPSCSGTMDPGMALSSSLGPDVTMAQVTTQVTRIRMASVLVAWPLDTSMVT